VLAHSRSRDFAYRQVPILVCVLVPLIVGIIAKAVDVVLDLT